MGNALVGVVGHTAFYADSSLGNNNAGFHNSLYRGKYLGGASEFTNTYSARIQAGTFEDMFVGDYFTINGVNWRIADFDPYYRCGDTSLASHHIAVIPDGNLYSTQWNTTNNTVTGGVNGGAGYVDSSIRANIRLASGDAQGAQAKVIAAFGDAHVLAYRGLLPSTYDSNGNATGWAWVDMRVDLLSEMEVYGAPAWSVGGKGYEIGHAKRQLSLFRHNPQMMNIRASYWLRSVYSATRACIVPNGGSADYSSASDSFGVRPLSLIA